MQSMNQNLGRILVLSDLHLWGPEDPLYRALLRFLDEQIVTNDKLFIVGDLFDLFIGNKQIFRERYQELIEKLKQLNSKNVEIYYIEGNHDFQLENLFEDSPHIKLYSDQIHYEWNGRKFLFSHGDKINWKDIGYHAFRLFTRNFFTQCLIEAIPGNVIDKIGTKMSKTSRSYHPEPDDQTIQLFRNYACEQITHGFDFVIMGHSHQQDDIKFRIENHEGQYINCGYPRKHKIYFEINPNEKFFIAKSWEELVNPYKPNLKAVK